MGSSGSTKTTTAPWKGQQQFLQDVFDQAAHWYYGANPGFNMPGLPQSTTGTRSFDKTNAGMYGWNPGATTGGGGMTWDIYQPGQDTGNTPTGGTGTTTTMPSGGGGGAGKDNPDIYPYQQGGFFSPDPNAAPQYFPGSTVVPWSPEQIGAINMMTGYGSNPNSPLAQAIGNVNGIAGGAGTPWSEKQYSLSGLPGEAIRNTVRGDYLQADNPVFKSMLSGITDLTRPGVDSSFAASGRFGSPLQAEAMARGVTSGMLPFLQSERGLQVGTAESEAARAEAARQAALGRSFNFGQMGADRQLQAAGMLPGLLGSQVGMLQTAGNLRQDMAQRNLQEQIDRWNFQQNAPLERLQQYMGLIQGNYGNMTKSSQPGSNPFLTGLGGASTGAGLGSMFGPWGTAIGGVGGGLAGGLGGK